MRNEMLEIARKAKQREITEQEAELQLLLLFSVGGSKSDEESLLPLKKKRIHKIINLDGDMCFYCGKKTYIMKDEGWKSNRATVDHVLPIAKGGLNCIDNCVNCCEMCNGSKGSDSILPPMTRIVNVKITTYE